MIFTTPLCNLHAMPELGGLKGTAVTGSFDIRLLRSFGPVALDALIVLDCGCRNRRPEVG